MLTFQITFTFFLNSPLSYTLTTTAIKSHRFYNSPSAVPVQKLREDHRPHLDRRLVCQDVIYALGLSVCHLKVLRMETLEDLPILEGLFPFVDREIEIELMCPETEVHSHEMIVVLSGHLHYPG